MQGRTHNCGQLRLENVGEEVKLVGWYENLRKVSKNLGFLILRDFYGTTQIVAETEEQMEQLSGINYESTLEIVGIVEREAPRTARFLREISRLFLLRLRFSESVSTTSFLSRLIIQRMRMRT